MATGQEIINKALIELASEGSRVLETGRTLQQELEDALNTVLVEDIPGRWPFQWLVGQPPDPVVLVPSQTVYDVPTSAREVVKIILDTGELSDTKPMRKLPLRRFLTMWANVDYAPEDKPHTWAQINDAKFRVAPRPDAAWTLRVYSTKTPARITNFSATVVACPDRYQMLVLPYGVAAIGATKIEDVAKAQSSMQIYEQGIGKMVAEDKRDPDVEYQLQPFYATGRMYTSDYWRQPGVRSVE